MAAFDFRGNPAEDWPDLKTSCSTSHWVISPTPQKVPVLKSVLLVASVAVLGGCADGKSPSKMTPADAGASSQDADVHSCGACGPDSECLRDSCVCSAGTEWDGARCVEVDGCREASCGAGMACVDRPAPEVGYDCKDLDACANHLCGPTTACHDQPAPSDGFLCGEASGCAETGCPTGYACEASAAPSQGESCVDVDGCADTDCGSGRRCEDLLAPMQGHLCVDIDDCEKNDTCGPGSQCLDHVAPDTGHTCQDIDGCFGTTCGPGMSCVDSPAPSSGHTCVDTNACVPGACGLGMDCLDELAPSNGFQCADTDGCAGVDCGTGMVCEDNAAPDVGYRCKDVDGCLGAVCASGLTCYDEPSPKQGYGCIDPFDLLYKWLPPADKYETRFNGDVAPNEMAELVQSWGDEGFVVTTGFVYVSVYRGLIAVRPEAAHLQQPFDTRVSFVYSDELSAEGASLGAEGYLITATLGAGPYILIGTRPRGSSVRFESSIVTTNGNGLKDALAGLQAGGYFLAATSADNGFVLCGMRPRGSTLYYELHWDQVLNRDSIGETARSFGDAGFVLTSANTTPRTFLYTHFGARPSGVIRPYGATTAYFTTEESLGYLGETGFIVSGAGRDGEGYPLAWAISRYPPPPP